MPHRLVVMGDNHGDVDSLYTVRDEIADEPVDYAVHVGDFTNAWRTARQTDDVARGKDRGTEQLRAVEGVLADIDAHTDNGLVWVYGNQDYWGDLAYDLSVGTELPDDDVVSVGDLRFTNSLAHVAPDVVLVTHLEYWRLADHFSGLAHFCGNSHRGRHRDRRLNASFLQVRDPETERKRFGGYFIVELDAGSIVDVECRPLGDLARIECDRHAERGVQFQPPDRGCMFCNEAGALYREMCASGFYGLTHDTARETVTDAALIEYATSLWDQPPDGLRDGFRTYLEGIEDHRYAPLTRTDAGRLALAEKTYSY